MYGSVTVTYSCVQGGYTGTGNTSSDPLFADAQNYDYRLKSVAGRWGGSAWVHDAVNSPAIDAGNPADSYANEPASNGGRINMGFDGNTDKASKSPETTDPSITDLFPEDESTIETATPTLSALWSDGQSGVNPSSAVILLDQQNVTNLATLTESGFSLALPQEMALTDDSHTLSVQVSDYCGNQAQASSTFTVSTEEADTTAPDVTIVSPSNGSSTASRTPALVVLWDDGEGSGINLSTASVKLDNQDITAQLQLSLSGFSYELPTSMELTDSSHLLEISIEDAEGNLGSASSSFTVDATPPTFSSPTPTPEVFTRFDSPAMAVSYADSGVGVDATSVKLFIDENDETAEATVTASALLYDSEEELCEGPHVVTVQVKDLLGNESVMTWLFFVDTVGPDVTDCWPAEGQRIKEVRPTIRAQCADMWSGVASAVVRLDDQPLFTMVEGGQVTAAPEADLSEGSHSFTVTVQDGAGNESVSAVYHFTVDVSGPAAPVVVETVREYDCVRLALETNADAVATLAAAAGAEPVVASGNIYSVTFKRLPGGRVEFAYDLAFVDAAGNEGQHLQCNSSFLTAPPEPTLSTPRLYSGYPVDSANPEEPADYSSYDSEHEPPLYVTDLERVRIRGTITGGTPPFAMTITGDQGGGKKTTVYRTLGSEDRDYTVPLDLLEGANTVTVKVKDAANWEVGSAPIAVCRNVEEQNVLVLEYPENRTTFSAESLYLGTGDDEEDDNRARNVFNRDGFHVAYKLTVEGDPELWTEASYTVRHEQEQPVASGTVELQAYPGGSDNEFLVVLPVGFMEEVEDGTYTLHVAAANGIGGSVSDDLEITVDTTAPSTLGIWNNHGQQSQDGNVWVTTARNVRFVTASSSDGVVAIRQSGQVLARAWEDGPWMLRTPVVLTDTSNSAEVQFEVEDLAGNVDTVAVQLRAANRTVTVRYYPDGLYCYITLNGQQVLADVPFAFSTCDPGDIEGSLRLGTDEYFVCSVQEYDNQNATVGDPVMLSGEYHVSTMGRYFPVVSRVYDDYTLTWSGGAPIRISTMGGLLQFPAYGCWLSIMWADAVDPMVPGTLPTNVAQDYIDFAVGGTSFQALWLDWYWMDDSLQNTEDGLNCYASFGRFSGMTYGEWRESEVPPYDPYWWMNGEYMFYENHDSYDENNWISTRPTGLEGRWIASEEPNTCTVPTAYQSRYGEVKAGIVGGGFEWPFIWDFRRFNEITGHWQLVAGVEKTVYFYGLDFGEMGSRLDSAVQPGSGISVVPGSVKVYPEDIFGVTSIRQVLEVRVVAAVGQSGSRDAHLTTGDVDETVEDAFEIVPGPQTGHIIPDVDRQNGAGTDFETGDGLARRSPGAWVLVNDDNDLKASVASGRPAADMDETDDEIEDEDDLIELQLADLDPESMDEGDGVTLTIEAIGDGAPGARIWRRPTKGSESTDLILSLDPSATKAITGWSISTDEEDLESVIENGIWLEGLATGELKITLTVTKNGETSEDWCRVVVVDNHHEGSPTPSAGSYGPLEPVTGAMPGGVVTLTGGNLVFQDQITRYAGNLVPFNVYVTYNSRSTMGGEIGPKLQHNYEMRLMLLGTRILLISEDGRRVWFDQVAGNNSLYKAEDASGLAAQIEVEGTYPDYTGYILRRMGRLFYEFDELGRLVAISDTHGGSPSATSMFDQAGETNRVTLAYEQFRGKEVLSTVTDAFERSISFYRTGGALVIADHTGEAATVAPDKISGGRAQSWGITDSVFTDPTGKEWRLNSMDYGSYELRGRVLDVKRPDAVAGGTGLDAQLAKEILYNDATDQVVVKSWRSQYESSAGLTRAESTFTIDRGLNVWTAMSVKVDASNSRTAQRVYDQENKRRLTEEAPFGVTAGSGAKWQNFTSRGLPQTYVDLDGKSWIFTYNVWDSVASEKNPAASAATTYNFDASGNGDIDNIVDPAGKRTYYVLDACGRVTEVTPPTKQGMLETRFITEYVSGAPYPSSAVRESDRPDGPPESASRGLRYNELGWMLAEQDWNGNWTWSDCDVRGNVLFTTGPKPLAEASFPRPPIDADYSETVYDLFDRPTELRNPDGGMTRLAYDCLGRLVRRETDVDEDLVNVSVMTYDGRDNLIKHEVGRESDAGGLVATWFRYNLAGEQIATLPAANPRTGSWEEESFWTNAYKTVPDGRGFPRQVIDPLGHTWTREYRNSGLVSSVTDPCSWVTGYLYEDDGQIQRVTDPSGYKTDYTYKPDTRQLDTVSYPGSGNRRVEQYSYDAHDLLETVTSSGELLGNHVSTTGRNQLDWVTLRSYGVAQSAAATQYTSHNASGQPTAGTNPSGMGFSMGYDDKGLQTSASCSPMALKRNENGNWGYEQVTSTSRASYGNAGQKLADTDPSGRTWGYSYYLNYAAKASTDPAGKGVSSKYDGRGNLIESTDQLSRTTHFFYDGNNRLIRREDPDGAKWNCSYDLADRLEYEWQGEPTPIPTPETQVSMQATRYQYLDNGQLWKVTDGSGKTTTYGYVLNAEALVKTVTDGLGKTTTIAFDGAGREWKITDPRGFYVEKQYYDSGLLKSVRDKSGRLTQFTYDERGRIATRQNPAGKTITWTYEDSYTDGEYSQQVLAPRVTITDPDGGKVRLSYSPLGGVAIEEVLEGMLADGITPVWTVVVRREFGAAGELVCEKNGRGESVKYARDLVGRVSGKEYRDSSDHIKKTLTFGYYDNGLLRNVLGGGTNLACQYDAMGRPTVVADGTLCKEVRYEYDLFGRRVSRKVRIGPGEQAQAVAGLADTGYEYDGAGRLFRVNEVSPGTSSLLRRAEFLYDNAGRRSSLTRSTYGVQQADVVTTYGFNDANQLVSVAHRRNAELLASAAYRLDADGNRLGAAYHDGSWSAWGLDAAGRLVSETHGGGGDSFQRYYAYSDGGDIQSESLAASYNSSWNDDFERVSLGSDYTVVDGQWALTDAGGSKRLERQITDPNENTGPALVTNNAQTKSGCVRTSGWIQPLDGTEDAPLMAGLVFGWTSADDYWVAGANSWMAVPEGEEDECLHLRYFIAHVESGVAAIKSVSGDPEVMEEEVDAFELRISVTPASFELEARPAGAGAWEPRLSAASPWPDGSMPAARSGFWCDRWGTPPDNQVPCRFDNLAIEWSTGSAEKADYEYFTVGGFRNHKLQSVSGLGKNLQFTYDADGNVASRTASGVQSNFEYTFENRLARVTRDGSTLREYAFQGDSWQRRTATEDGVTTSFLYDGDDVLAEFDNEDVLTAAHAASGLDSELWTLRWNGSGFDHQTPLADAQNVIAVADAAGSVTARYRYRAFGERVQTYGQTPPARMDPTFQGRTYDAGLGIYDYRNRSFDPATGRFLQRDPVLGGDPLFNPYCFPGNNPVTGSDPMGTDYVELRYDSESEDDRRNKKGSATMMYVVTSGKGRTGQVLHKFAIGHVNAQQYAPGMWKRGSLEVQCDFGLIGQDGLLKSNEWLIKFQKDVENDNIGVAASRAKFIDRYAAFGAVAGAVKAYTDNALGVQFSFIRQQEAATSRNAVIESHTVLMSIEGMSWYAKYPVIFGYSFVNTFTLGAMHGNDRASAAYYEGIITRKEYESQMRWNGLRATVGAALVLAPGVNGVAAGTGKYAGTGMSEFLKGTRWATSATPVRTGAPMYWGSAQRYINAWKAMGEHEAAGATMQAMGESPSAMIVAADLRSGAMVVMTEGEIPTVLGRGMLELANSAGGLGVKTACGNVVGRCAEFRGANELVLRYGSALDDIWITRAYRPRTGAFVPRCTNCTPMFGSDVLKCTVVGGR